MLDTRGHHNQPARPALHKGWEREGENAVSGTVRNPDIFCTAGEKPSLPVLTANGSRKLWPLLLMIKSALKPRFRKIRILKSVTLTKTLSWSLFPSALYDEAPLRMFN